MREIKFRVWDNVDYMSSPFTLNDIINRKIEFTSDCIVMQYTGKKDDNEKDIYDGDLVTDLNGETHSVEWNDDTLKWQLSNGRPLNDEENYSSYLIVVGNIFENKELILER